MNIQFNRCIALLRTIKRNLETCHRHRVMPIFGTEYSYIPIAKNGCTTLKSWVYQVKYRKHLEKAHFGKINEELFWLSTQKIASSPSRYFMVLRDPLERLFSCYANKILRGRIAKPGNAFFVEGVFRGFHEYNKMYGERLFYPEMHFEKFAEVVAGLPDLLGDNHFNSQATFAPFDEEKFLEKARIVLLPDLQEGMKIIFGEQMLLDVPLLHRMKSDVRLDRGVLSKSCVETVQKRYHRDYALLEMLQNRNLIWNPPTI